MKATKKGISKRKRFQKKLDLDFKPKKCILDRSDCKSPIKRLQKHPIKLDYDSESGVRSEPDANETSLWANFVPYEIMFKIFKQFSFMIQGDVRKLNSLKLVCRQWCRVASDERLWHYLDMSAFSFKSSVKRILSTPRQFDYLVKLNLNHMKEFTCDNLNQILSRCNPNVVKELNLACCDKIQVSKKNMNFIHVIGKNCPNLSSLNLTGLKVRNIFCMN